MFLFKAFVELLLADLYRPDSSAVLALEEPETHLHPQAARSLWRHISELPGQKIVTTHSPYFLQNVPFRDIRVIRIEAEGTTVRSLPREFRVVIPHVQALDAITATSGGLILYDRGLSELVLTGVLPEATFRLLVMAYHGRADSAELNVVLRGIYERSQTFVPDDELEKLETFARRIRGEIFFARRWFLVEGQSDYQIVHGIASGLGYNLDEHGVSVIDFQNCGNPECFAVLARALGYPWLVLVDGDPAGQGYLDTIKDRGFSTTEMGRRSFKLPVGTMEQQLVADGLQTELKSILVELHVPGAAALDDVALVDALEKNKSSYAALLRRRCANDPMLAQRMPEAIRLAIQSLRGLE
jgi:putative ATP-dependent endonuclease of OLD family